MIRPLPLVSAAAGAVFRRKKRDVRLSVWFVAELNRFETRYTRGVLVGGLGSLEGALLGHRGAKKDELSQEGRFW